MSNYVFLKIIEQLLSMTSEENFLTPEVIGNLRLIDGEVQVFLTRKLATHEVFVNKYKHPA